MRNRCKLGWCIFVTFWIKTVRGSLIEYARCADCDTCSKADKYFRNE